jgi:hypothetical protein
MIRQATELAYAYVVLERSFPSIIDQRAKQLKEVSL